MFPIPALPLPKLHSRVEPYDARTLAMVCGFALAGQALLPWSGGQMFWGAIGMTLGHLLIGGGLIALFFLWPPALKQGQRVMIVGGAGVLGMLWSFAGSGGFFFVSSFGMLGMASAGIGLNLWSRNGYSKEAWMLVVGGLGGLALALLIPVGSIGGGLPLISIFTHIGDKAPFIVARILYTLLSLGFLFVLVLLVMNVVLKKDQADPEQVERFWPVMYFFVPAALFLYGLFSFFGAFSTMVHMLVVSMIYLTLVVWGGTIFMEARLRGENLMES